MASPVKQTLVSFRIAVTEPANQDPHAHRNSQRHLRPRADVDRRQRRRRAFAVVADRPAGQPDPCRHHQRPDRLGGRRPTAVDHHGSALRSIAVRALLLGKGARYRATPRGASSCSCRSCRRSRPFPGWRSDGRTGRSLPRTSSATASSKCSRSRGDRKLKIERYEYEAATRCSRTAASRTPIISSPSRNGSARWPLRCELVDADDASERRTAGGGVCGADQIDQKPAGVLAIIIELTRVSNFLSQLTVGKSAGAFILDRDGGAIAAPDADADEVTPLKTDQPLFPVAVDAIRRVPAAPTIPARAQPLKRQVTRDGKVYKTVLTPISFPGWSLVTVVPESEFLGPVQDDDPEPADRPCGADRVRRAAVGMAGAAPDRGTADQGGERDQACRALRSRQGRAPSVAADRDREPFRRDRRHGAGAGRVPQIYPGRSGAAPDQRRQWRAARRRGAADERDVHRSRRLHRHVGAAGRPHHSAAVALFRFRLGADPGDTAAPSTNSSAMP